MRTGNTDYTAEVGAGKKKLLEMCPAIMVQKLVGEIREKNSVLDNGKMKNKEFNNIMSFLYMGRTDEEDISDDGSVIYYTVFKPDVRNNFKEQRRTNNVF